MSDPGLYLYALIPDTGSRVFDCRAVGNEECPVFTLAAERCAAVVSPRALEEMDPTRRNMLSHTRVQEHVMQQFPILPVSFGTILPDGVTLLRCLDAQAEEIDALFADIRDCVELGVKIGFHPEPLYADIIAAEPALRTLRDSLQGRSVEETYYERVELGRRVEAAVQERRALIAAEAEAALAPHYTRSAELKLLDDHMILNAAYLVPRAQEPAFDRAINGIAESLGDTATIKYVGPVPPYNFVSFRAAWDPPGARQAA